MVSLAQRVATSCATVMLTGESGSGKEVLARNKLVPAHHDIMNMQV